MTNETKTEELLNDAIDSLEWMIQEDDTRDMPNNGYWIHGLETARKVVAQANGVEYECGEWDNYNADDWDAAL